MSPDTKPDGEMCIDADTACLLYDDGMAALDFVEAGLKELRADGMPNPALEARVKASKQKLAAAKRKWRF